MSTQTSLNKQLPTLRRDNVISSSNWTAFLNHFEYGSGFALIILLVPNSDVAQRCKDELHRVLGFSEKRLIDLPIVEQVDLRRLASSVFNSTVSDLDGAIWVESVISSAVPTYSIWREAWRKGMISLNHARSSLQKRLKVPVVLVGAPWIKELIKETAPDLWSIRSLVTTIEPAAFRTEDELVVRENRTASPQHIIADDVYGSDPVTAEKQIQKLRDSPGKGAIQARLLYRAASGYLERGNARRAASAAQEARQLLEARSDLKELADVTYLLGRAFRNLCEFEQATECLEEADRLFAQLGRVDCGATAAGTWLILRRLSRISMQRLTS